MTDEIIFYQNPRSRAVMAHWMLEEVGAPYRPVLLDFDKAEQKSADFLAINPMGKVPTIVHRDVVVTETGAIITYLADAFPEAGLAPPPGDPRRGTWLRWLFFGAGCIEPALLDRMTNRPLPERKGMIGYGSYEDVLAALEKMLDPGPFILGDSFSAADLYVGSLIHWAMMFGAPGVKSNPLFDEYVTRLTSRPAYQRIATAAG